MTNRSLLAPIAITILLASTVPSPAHAQTPKPFICMYGHSDDAGVTKAFRKLIPQFNVIEGTSSNAAFIKELRTKGCIYAAHVTNPVSATEDELVAEWRAPFENDLGGQLPGGYDAIAIDELRANPDGGTQSQRVCGALAKLRELYPKKQIYAAATWHLGYEAAKYTQQLRAVHEHVDMLMLEAYLRETKPAFGYFANWADQLKAIEPSLLQKTVYGLGVAQRGYLYDDTTEVGFLGHLDRQFFAIRTDADAAKMPGIMFWVYYRSETDVTPEYLARLVDHYYLQKKTDFFGNGDTKQLVANPQFETLDGWKLTAGAGGRVEQFRYGSINGLQNDHDDHGWSSHGEHGLKMVRGRTNNVAEFKVSGLDPRMTYVASVWVNADKPGRRAGLRIADAEAQVIAERETDRAGRGTQWNEWTRLILRFTPSMPDVRIELHDAKAEPGTVLFWDFVELEAAGPADMRPDPKETIANLTKLGAKLRFDKHGRVLEVNLQETKTTDADLAPLKHLKHVKEISLHRTKVTSTGLENLAHLTRLEKLFLTDTPIDDRGLVHLSKLNNLKVLGMSGTAVSDARLKHLKELRGLESLFLIGTKVTDQGVEALSSLLPACDIIN
jgi:hypothetical protein